MTEESCTTNAGSEKNMEAIRIKKSRQTGGIK
jgi:hypothetical protein